LATRASRLKSLSDLSAARPLRVVHVLGTLNSGGPQWRLLKMIPELDSFSHVVVFEGSEKGLLYPRYVELCEVVHCPRGGGLPLSFLFRLAKVLKQIRPDAVIAHLFGNHTVVAWAARLAGVPVTFGVSTNDPVHYSGSRWWPMALAHLGRPVCKGEIAVSNAVGGILTSRLLLPSRRVTVICNGCPVDEIASRAAAARIAPPIPRRPGITRLIMVAAITRTKNYQTVIRALDVLRRRGRPAEFLIAGASGRGQRHKAVERVIDELDLRESVTFLGVREDVPELLGASDILVHSSNSEGFAMVVSEGMAAGLPVVAADIPPCREQLDNGACGSLFPSGNAEALADAIEKILDDEKFRTELVKAAFDRVSSRYDVSHMAAGYEALLMSHLRATDAESRA
jgi:glycosyltransferase involved in cell wall biosynthesis